jgi:hypothetical protein
VLSGSVKGAMELIEADHQGVDSSTDRLTKATSRAFVDLESSLTYPYIDHRASPFTESSPG